LRDIKDPRISQKTSCVQGVKHLPVRRIAFDGFVTALYIFLMATT